VKEFLYMRGEVGRNKREAVLSLVSAAKFAHKAAMEREEFMRFATRAWERGLKNENTIREEESRG